MHAAALEWLPKFMSHLTTERRLSTHTDSNYGRDLNGFRAYCDRQGIERWTALDNQHIRMYAASEHRRGQSPRTIQRRLSALRTFFNFLIREGELVSNPAIGIQAPKRSKRLPSTRMSRSRFATKRSWSSSILRACVSPSSSACRSRTWISKTERCA
jgi:integrase/recombinase XerC